MKNKIVLVPFPFDDLSQTKIRPALCLTGLISGYNHVVIAFITSQVDKANEKSDIKIHLTDSDFEKTGLKVDSAIRLHRLVTIPQQIILRELGILPSYMVENVRLNLKTLFEL